MKTKKQHKGNIREIENLAWTLFQSKFVVRLFNLPNYFNKLKTLKFFLLTFLILLGPASVYADNDEGTQTINLNPTLPATPSKPTSPTYIKLSAIVDCTGVTIFSNVDVMAQVQIIGSNSGVIFDSFVALAPSFSSPLPSTDESLTIMVTIGDMIYVGYSM